MNLTEHKSWYERKFRDPYLTMPTKAQTVTGTLCSVGLGKLRSPCILKTYVVTVKGFLRLLSRLKREGFKLALNNHFGSFPPGYALHI